MMLNVFVTIFIVLSQLNDKGVVVVAIAIVILSGLSVRLSVTLEIHAEMVQHIEICCT